MYTLLILNNLFGYSFLKTHIPQTKTNCVPEVAAVPASCLFIYNINSNSNNCYAAFKGMLVEPKLGFKIYKWIEGFDSISMINNMRPNAHFVIAVGCKISSY